MRSFCRIINEVLLQISFLRRMHRVAVAPAISAPKSKHPQAFHRTGAPWSVPLGKFGLPPYLIGTLPRVQADPLLARPDTCITWRRHLGGSRSHAASCAQPGVVVILEITHTVRHGNFLEFPFTFERQPHTHVLSG